MSNTKIKEGKQTATVANTAPQTPVSYTHLDVYKRQHRDNPPCF